MGFLIAALEEFGELLEGRKLTCLLRSTIAVSGLDMSAGRFGQGGRPPPLCVVGRLGCSVGLVRSHNSNGLWLPEAVATETIAQRDKGNVTVAQTTVGPHVIDDIATIEATRKAVGNDVHLMVDFNKGPTSPKLCAHVT